MPTAAQVERQLQETRAKLAQLDLANKRAATRTQKYKVGSLAKAQILKGPSSSYHLLVYEPSTVCEWLMNSHVKCTSVHLANLQKRTEDFEAQVQQMRLNMLEQERAEAEGGTATNEEEGEDEGLLQTIEELRDKLKEQEEDMDFKNEELNNLTTVERRQRDEIVNSQKIAFEVGHLWGATRQQPSYPPCYSFKDIL